MRTLALFFLAANLLYFAWAKWIDVSELSAPSAHREQVDVPKIVLASERPKTSSIPPSITQAPLANEPTPTPNEPKTEASCVSVGPFQDLPAAAQAVATLRDNGFESRQRFEQGELWVGYWLTIQDIKTREAADKAITALKEHGIADAYVISGSDPPNLVSLGVFKEQERAQRLMQQVKTLGLNAQISNRTRTGSVYWLDVPLGQTDKRFDLSLLGAEPGKILRLELSSCH
jgi:cell division protein FtsN